MTSYLIIEQLVAERQADLARSWPRPTTARRRRRGATRRWGARAARRRTGGAPPSLSAVPPGGMGASGGDAAAASAASVAHLVAEHGLRGNEPAVAHVLRLARRHHVLPVHAAVVADRSLPDVVRERALGRLLAGLPRRADARTEAFDDAA